MSTRNPITSSYRRHQNSIFADECFHGSVHGVGGRAFLRWAGGKQRLVKLLIQFVPPSSAYHAYYEPFFGAGSLFFRLQPGNAVLSDINADLMNCHRQVAKYPNAIADLVEYYARHNNRDFYYKVRNISCRDPSRRQHAARFIYLNKAAFNGIYRVNKSGKFNVPYGPSFSGLAIPSRQALILASKCLKKAKIVTGDFEQVLEEARSGDFVYLDPPYPPRSRTAFFTHYSVDRFNWEEQERVSHLFSRLSERGCLVMLSNADQKKVTSLYSRFSISKINALRWLGSNGDRFRVREVVVTNYKL